MTTAIRSVTVDHEWAKEAVPWLINGTIGDADARRLRAHFDSCEECRRDLQLEEQLARTLAARPAVDYAPQASLAKMMKRLDRSEMFSPRRWLFGRLAPTDERRRRMISFAIAAQAATMVVLVVALAWLVWKPEPKPAYVLAGAPVLSLPHLQVIFDDKTSAADILAILAEVKGRVIGGPSSAGVYLVAFDAGADALKSAAQALQGHPRVRFVAVVQAPPAR